MWRRVADVMGILKQLKPYLILESFEWKRRLVLERVKRSETVFGESILFSLEISKGMLQRAFRARASRIGARFSSESKEPSAYRSTQWFGLKDKNGFLYRRWEMPGLPKRFVFCVDLCPFPALSWLKNQGYPDDVFDGRPVIGICQTHSDFTPCNGHFRELAEYVKRGVWEAGGFPLEFPCMSLGESLIRPTAMLFRNLMAMDVEESIRGFPMDGVVLLTGCDKTTPGPVRVLDMLIVF
jgi:Dehydratase family